MDANRRKELREAYRSRRPKMGVLVVRCEDADAAFAEAARDAQAAENSLRAKLGFGNHPNRRLQDLWNEYGETRFVFELVEELEYDELDRDYAAELEALRDLYLAEHPTVLKVWK